MATYIFLLIVRLAQNVQSLHPDLVEIPMHNARIEEAGFAHQFIKAKVVVVV